jgi:nucleoside-diphosphate-sugar epimerase
MRRVLIAGCGYVGVAAADLFHAAGWEVEGWTHSQASADALSSKPYRIRAVDLTSERAVASAATGFDAVVHCASSGGGGAESYRHIYLEGARNLLDVLRASAFLFTSSTSVYAQADGDWVTEESPAEPPRETGKILRETEALVLARGGVIARVAGIYGPGRSALLRKLRAGEARLDGDGTRFVNQVHRDDVASSLLLLIERPVSSEIFNVADDQPLTQRECYGWLANHLGLPMPERADIPAERKRGASNKRVSNAKLRRFGWAPRYPTFAEGMTNSVLPAAEK